jgi:hypothetical protein
LVLWPHARPWYFSPPQPMLRAIPDAAKVAGILASALNAAVARSVQSDSSTAHGIRVDGGLVAPVQASTETDLSAEGEPPNGSAHPPIKPPTGATLH